MSDPKAEALGEQAPRASDISDEIGRTVSSIWQRRSGVRPSAVSTEVDGDTIRCVIEEGDADSADETADADAPEVPSTGSNAYRSECTGAISRITKRSVSAFIVKHDEKTGVATQTFVLERMRIKH